MKIKGTMQTAEMEDGIRVVRLYRDGPFAEPAVLRGEAAERHLRRQARVVGTFQVLFLPLSAVFYLLLGIHNATDWVLSKVLP